MNIKKLGSRLKTFEAFHGYGPKKKRVLMDQRMKFLPLLEQLPDDVDFSEFNQKDKWVAISFLRNGGEPTEIYLERILDLLVKNGIDTSSIRTDI
jgi:hypothetical protein